MRWLLFFLILCFLPVTGVVLAGDRLDGALMARALERAQALERLHALIVAREGRVHAEKTFRGPGPAVAVNVKSVAKSVISALVGIAIGRGMLAGPDAAVAPLLEDRLPARPDPRLKRLTVGHLLTMQAGLERTSGRNYGRWVTSKNWVRHILARPFVDEPGGRMLYSTGNFHLLSAILARAAGRPTHALARDWLGKPLGVTIPDWQRDPQGVHMGGNNMALSPRALLRFGELYRLGGTYDGRRVLPEGWVARSWTPRTRSPYSGDAYGYGWFITRFCDQAAYYARGFGGQFVFVLPDLGMTIVITSDRRQRTRVGGYRQELLSLIADDLVPAALAADGRRCPPR